MVLTTYVPFSYAEYKAFDNRIMRSVSGSAMEYATGDACLAGPAIIPELHTDERSRTDCGISNFDNVALGSRRFLLGEILEVYGIEKAAT